MKKSVVISGGNQYLVSKGDKLWVDNIKSDVDSEIMLDSLLTIDGDKVTLGKPYLKEQTKAKVLAHAKADKVRVTRFKAKSRYDKTRGFRHSMTQLEILE